MLDITPIPGGEDRRGSRRGIPISVRQWLYPVRGFQARTGSTKSHRRRRQHFAGYGAAEVRDYDAADISDDQLWNVYFLPLRVRGRGRRNVMTPTWI